MGVQAAFRSIAKTYDTTVFAGRSLPSEHSPTATAIRNFQGR